jgi:uncharacterized protein (TIGR03435 family)
MKSPLLRLAITCVRTWTWLYTLGMPTASRERRRAEIESDLWEFQRDADGDDALASAAHVLHRLLLGMPDDLGWRLEEAALAGTITQGTIALGGRVAGAALCIGALWAIDADAGRRRPAIAAAGRAGGFNQAIDGTVTSSLPLLTARIVATVGASMLPHLAAQSPPVAPRQLVFEAASVKANRSGDVGWRLAPQPGGRLTGTNVPAAALIRFAYDLPDFQVMGGPNWLSSDRFDIVAKAEGDASVAQERVMLRRLLADRFKLIAHTETQQLPIYALVIARSDGRIGPRLRRAEGDCGRVDQPSSDAAFGPSPSNGPPRCGYFGFAPGTDLPSGRGGMAFRGLTMAALAKTLVPMVRRSVSDQTRLTGYFDAEFDFMIELPPPPPPPGVPNPSGREPLVSVFTVFPEQLGLKLDSRRGPVEVLVIDRAEQPTPD